MSKEIDESAPLTSSPSPVTDFHPPGATVQAPVTPVKTPQPSLIQVKSPAQKGGVRVQERSEEMKEFMQSDPPFPVDPLMLQPDPAFPVDPLFPVQQIQQAMGTQVEDKMLSNPLASVETISRAAAAMNNATGDGGKESVPENVMAISMRTLTGQVIPLQIKSPPAPTVLTLKQALEDEQNIPVSFQRLIFGGKELVDEMPISTYNITDGSAVHVVLKQNQLPPVSASFTGSLVYFPSRVVLPFVCSCSFFSLSLSTFRRTRLCMITIRSNSHYEASRSRGVGDCHNLTFFLWKAASTCLGYSRLPESA